MTSGEGRYLGLRLSLTYGSGFMLVLLAGGLTWHFTSFVYRWRNARRLITEGPLESFLWCLLMVLAIIAVATMGLLAAPLPRRLPSQRQRIAVRCVRWLCAGSIATALLVFLYIGWLVGP